MGQCLPPRVRWLSRLICVLGIAVSILWGHPDGTRAAEGPPDITATHAVVVSADTGEVLFDRAMDAAVAPASLTKIFTAAVALDLADLDDTITTTADDPIEGSSMGLVPGQTLSLRTLLHGLMLVSGNDAAMAIARGLGGRPGTPADEAVRQFMQQVNDTAARLGLTHTHLVNPHGLDTPGHVSSARDIAAMTMYALEDPDFRQIIGTPYYRGDGFELYQSNELLSAYPGLIGGKTGVTDEAGYCLVEVAQRDGHTVVVVLLGSTVEDWYADATALLDYGFATLATAASDPARPRITLAPSAPAATVPVATAAPAVGSLTVDRVADTTAVVRPSDAAPAGGGLSWRWPLASVITMGLALALVVNYPLLLGLGGLMWQRRGHWRFLRDAVAGLARGMPRRRHPAARGRESTRAGQRRTAPVPRASGERRASPGRPTSPAGPVWVPASTLPAEPRIVPLDAAQALAIRAIRLAGRGDYHAATQEFARALRADPSYDLTRCPGFWSMSPAGYVAAARAYLLLNRPTDARTLATVAQLSFGPNRELERLLARTGRAVAAV
ncbi:MAG: D-alanyl-D-alanine carboxypeptidase family protein [Sphaerobacter sp.]|nr:D-alanyl-D-alanine carboxypeptidase family protein [Sphaerobacter sp.]